MRETNYAPGLRAVVTSISPGCAGVNYKGQISRVNSNIANLEVRELFGATHHMADLTHVVHARLRHRLQTERYLAREIWP